jgi:hypothetical protein
MPLLLFLFVFTFMACYMAMEGPTSPDATQEDTHHD